MLRHDHASPIADAVVVCKPEYGMRVHVIWNLEIETYVSYVYVEGLYSHVGEHATCLGPFYGYTPVFWRSADRNVIKGIMLCGDDELQTSSSDDE